jgi:hypothetical protein
MDRHYTGLLALGAILVIPFIALTPSGHREKGDRQRVDAVLRLCASFRLGSGEVRQFLSDLAVRGDYQSLETDKVRFLSHI